MFRFKWIAGLVALAAMLTFAIAADWNEIGRTIRKQLGSKAKPKYALLVFGKEAKTRVRVVEDGETLYVDRNGNGELSDKDERFTLTVSEGKNPHASLRDCNIEILDSDKKTRYVITSITIRPQAEDDKTDGERFLMANVEIKGENVSYKQYCDAKMVEDPDKARIAHFHGPLSIGPRTVNWKLTPELSKLTAEEPAGDIFAVVGTMDAAHGCWVVVRSEDLPKDLHPVVEVEYPSKKAGDAAIKQRYQLKQRC